VSVSFIHRGGEEMASYRYRCQIPARELDAKVNDYDADILVFTKPIVGEDELMRRAIARGQTVIADFCDDHFDSEYAGPLCHAMAELADLITCPTEAMRDRLAELGYEAHVVIDPYEFGELEPHCNGPKCLWFGHGTNFKSLERVLPTIYAPLTVVSNIPLALPWSLETMREEFAKADIVLLPSTKSIKSPNRAIEAIRQGCFVVAEPHPSITDFPGIWIGNIAEGITWASQNPSSAREKTRLAQYFVSTRYAPRIQADAWRKLFALAKSRSTSVAEKSAGPAGSTSTAMAAPI
jgi:hypothetical protein